jgi:hypothetical protein
MGLVRWLRGLFSRKFREGDATLERTTLHNAIAKVEVDRQGRILLNGQQISLETLKVELTLLKERSGAVVFSREDPATDPPPTVAVVIESVIAAITERQLPIQMEENERAQTPGPALPHCQCTSCGRQTPHLPLNWESDPNGREYVRFRCVACGTEKRLEMRDGQVQTQ